MVLTACKVSGTLAAYELTPAQDSSSNGDHTGGSGSGSSSSTGSKPSTSAPEQNESSVGFKDVPKNAYYFDAVEWAVKRQITSGTSAAEFDPDAPCTRAQIVTFLYRALGSPEPKTTGSFTDVPSGSYYEKAVSWAVEMGITTGVSSERFDPNAACTRAQAVTFLYRALGSQANVKARFSDVHDGSYYAGAVDWAVENGVINGISETLFGPDSSCTRAQTVTFLYRAAA